MHIIQLHHHDEECAWQINLLRILHRDSTLRYQPRFPTSVDAGAMRDFLTPSVSVIISLFIAVITSSRVSYYNWTGPTTMTQWILNQRGPDQWYTFWIVVVGLALALVFCLFPPITRVMQVMK
jgi:hypothetical protein